MNSEPILILIKIILTFIVLFVSSINILGWQKTIFKIQLKMFHDFGLGRKIMFFIGLVQLLGVTLMWFPLYDMQLGVIILLLTSLVGIILHFRFKTEKEATFAVNIFVLTLLILFLEASWETS